MAEAFFKDYETEHEARSAGTQVSKEGETIGEEEKARFVWEAMDKEGIDVRSYRRKQLTPPMVDWADKVIVITERESWPDYLLTSPKSIYWDITDPKGTDYNTHVRIREEVKNRVKGLIEILKL